MDNSEEQFILAADTQLISVADLPARTRNELHCAPDDLLLDRESQRSQSKLISAQTGMLLQEFRTAQTITGAILNLSRKLGSEALPLLESAFPTIQELVNSRILLPARSPASDRGTQFSRPGDRVGSFRLIRAIRNLEDSAVYLASNSEEEFAAVKLTPAKNQPFRDRLLREADFLSALEGLPVPRVLERGRQDGRCFFAMSWIEGIPAVPRSDEIRARGHDVRHSLLILSRRIVDLFADLHEAGVLHGDIKSSNLIVDRDDRAFLIDFGMAAREEENSIHRAWSFDSLEPEAAEQRLRGEITPPSFVSEQFALAVLIYRLAVGRPFRIPESRQRTALQQIAAYQKMPSFASRGGQAWPEMENVLRRALARNPDERYASTRDFSKALSGIEVQRGASAALAVNPFGLVEKLPDEATDPDLQLADLFPEPPRSSLHRGAAGLAWFFYRAAQLRDEGEFLAHADLWAKKACRQSCTEEGLVAPRFGVCQNEACCSSPLHDRSGPWAVRALIAASRGRQGEAQLALEEVVQVLEKEPKKRELFLGEAGQWAGAATLLEAFMGQGSLDVSRLESVLTKRLDRFRKWLGDCPPLTEEPSVHHLGIAHGWAGLIFAYLTGCRVLATHPSSTITTQLRELAALAEPVGRGCSWKGTLHPGRTSRVTPSYAPGWCSGSAGYVLLFSLAFEIYQEEEFLDVALRAAWHTWEHPDRNPNLCCGLAGRSLALARLYRILSDDTWLARAHRLVSSPELSTSREPGARYSLFRGLLGPALVSLELESPSSIVLPLLEPEGWLETQTQEGWSAPVRDPDSKRIAPEDRACEG